MFGKVGQLASMLTNPGAIKQLIIENAQPTIVTAIDMLKQKYGCTSDGVFSIACTPLAAEKTVVVTLIRWNNSETEIVGSSDIKELAELLPNNIMDVIKG